MKNGTPGGGAGSMPFHPKSGRAQLECVYFEGALSSDQEWIPMLLFRNCRKRSVPRQYAGILRQHQ